jgi:hypothetical protein
MEERVAPTQPSGSALRRTGFLHFAGNRSEVQWFKASASESASCVEIAFIGSSIYIQDSKSPDGGPVIALSVNGWKSLLAAVRG